MKVNMTPKQIALCEMGMGTLCSFAFFAVLFIGSNIAIVIGFALLFISGFFYFFSKGFDRFSEANEKKVIE